jgi:hypothetical protein
VAEQICGVRDLVKEDLAYPHLNHTAAKDQRALIDRRIDIPVR